MRIAVVTTDGNTVNDHFGKATCFAIYDLTQTGPVKVAERPVSPLSTGDPSHPFDPGRFSSIAEALEDCTRVYCTRIGARPASELAGRGIEAVPYQGAIAAISR